MKYWQTALVLIVAVHFSACSGSDPSGTLEESDASSIVPFANSPDQVNGCFGVVCPDLGPCSTGVCDPTYGDCIYTPLPGVACDDGNACTSNDGCGEEGTCVGNENLACDDDDPCTTNSCDVETGCLFLEADEGSICSDGDPCTTGDGCLNGLCLGTPIFCEDDDNPCTQELGCSGENGDCIVVELADETPCDDGNACTSDSTCTDGVCLVGIAVTCTDENPCTDDICNPKSGCLYTPNAAPCTDDSVCTSGDQCAQGQCQSTPLNCDDGNPCTNETCDSVSGCVFQDINVPCEDGNPCTFNDLCTDGQCLSGDQKTCNDGNPCTSESCILATGDCVYTATEDLCDDESVCTFNDVCFEGTCIGESVNCDDGNSCTAIACDAGDGCTFLPVAGGCDDGDPCTVGDHCIDAVCGSNDTKNCDDANPCTSETCINGQGCESAPVEGPCNDGNPCTDEDVCGGGSCAGTLPTYCDDNNACTSDTCTAETGCVYALNDGVCDDDNPCTNDDQCNESGFCAGLSLACDDENPCTTDTCIPFEGCFFAMGSGGCEDGNPCMAGDACSNGECTPGTTPLCDDGNPCTTDLCNDEGSCSTEPVENVCDDDDACTTGGLCEGGECISAPVSCDDSNPCTQDLCNPLLGCLYIDDTGDCDDGDFCTLTETCQNGVCTALSWLSCDDENACTVDSCLAATGCAYEDTESNECEDDNPCTESTTCLDGACVSGSDICACQEDVDCSGDDSENLCEGTHVCDKAVFPYACVINPNSVVTCPNEDPTGCTTPVCDPANGSCSAEVAIPTSQPCNDSNACTESETCVGTECLWGTPIACNDENPCTTDTCDSASGCVFTPNSFVCDDEDSCTSIDTCIAGSCVGTPCVANGLECVEGACIDTCYGTKFTCPGVSCLDILEKEGPSINSGMYWIDPPGSETEVPFQAFCDMVSDGGGWTAITPSIARDQFQAKVSIIELIASFGLDAQGRPFCEDGQGGHTCRYTFNIPFGYTDFYLLDYTAKPTETSTYVEYDPFEYIISSWVKGNDGTLGYTGADGFGDIGLGPYPSAAPVASFAGSSPEGFTCQSCEMEWPLGDTKFTDTTLHNSFGICWGEAGQPDEGIFPWWSGQIMVR